MEIFAKNNFEGSSLIMTAALLTSLCACSAKKGSTQHNDTVYENASSQTIDMTFESRQMPLISATNARQLGISDDDIKVLRNKYLE